MPRTGLFQTMTAGGKDLRRAAPALRVEGVPDRDHGGEVLGGEELRHERDLLDADSVFARDAAADADALLEDLVAGVQNALDLVRVALVEEEDGVDVPVAGVEDIGDPDVVTARDSLDEPQDVGQERPGHDAVLG